MYFYYETEIYEKRNVMYTLIYSIGFTEAVRILSLHVPSSYVLVENNTKPLILDCVYEFRPNDVGFVLKWYHNNYLIYQWIPPRKPYVFVSLFQAEQNNINNYDMDFYLPFSLILALPLFLEQFQISYKYYVYYK